MTLRKKAVVAGATGLVGRELVHLLLNNVNYEQVFALVRTKTPLDHPKLTQVVTDYSNLEGIADYLNHADVFCALGTTIKIAKTQEAFRKVDYEYPLQLAKLAQTNTANQFLVVTAMGANAQSKIFYSKVKGQLEDSLKLLGLAALHIFHPSLLLGDRKVVRRGERIGSIISKGLSVFLVGSLSKYKPIHVNAVARGMIQAAQYEAIGTQVYEYDQILELALKSI
jgi:uncharacterized protein YbjT (DUF2867 family)